MNNKPLPQKLEAEKELLSMIFLKNDLMTDLITQIKPGDFYSEPHKMIYNKMIQMYSKDIAISLTTLVNSFDKEVLGSIGGITYLSELGTMSASTGNFKFLLKLIKDLSDRRNIIRSCSNAMNEAYECDIESKAIIDKLETNFISMNDYDQEGTVNSMELMESTLNAIEKGRREGGKISGISTGYKNLDNAINGLVKQDLVLIAARPSIGKTSLVTNIIANISRDKKVLMHELEMSKEKIGIRLLASKSLRNPQALARGQVSESDLTILTEKCNEISFKDNLYLNCKGGLTFAEIRTEAKKIKLKFGLDVLVIDHIGKIRSNNLKANRNDQLGEISEGLKTLAKDLDICVVALSQLSRACELRPDKHPQLSDLRDSGCLEQDADTIMFLYRDDYYAEREDRESKNPNIMEIMIAKNRDGEVGMLELNYLAKYQIITEPLGLFDVGSYQPKMFEK